MRSPLDWSSLASHALDQVARPACVVDDDCVVHGWNAAMEALTGRGRGAVVGKHWNEARGDAGERRSRPDALEQAVAKGRNDVSTTIVSGGRVLAAKLSVARSGEPPGALSLVVVVEHRSVERAARSGEGDLWYEIGAAPHARFSLRTVRGGAAPSAVGPDGNGGACFETLQGRSTPCPGCPAIAIQGGETRTAVLASGEGQEPLRLVTARASDERVRVSSCEVDDETLWSLVETKVKLLSRRADLSVREQDVLLWLLRGRSPQDVATLLGIAPRTVKFHQANLLRKLGAESRADLLRLIF